MAARDLHACELRHHPSVAECLDRGDAADGELLREGRVGVDVDLDERDRTLPRRDGRLEHGSEGVARAAPVRPEVDEHGCLRRTRDDVCVEGRFRDVHSLSAPRS